MSIFMAVALFAVHPVNAQVDGNPDQPSNCGNCEGNQGGGQGNSVPIDGGAGVLLAAGAAYGLKKLRDYRKQKPTTEPTV